MRHALIVPVCRPGDEVNIQVPGYGSRMIGPVIAGRRIGGFMVEIGAHDEGALRELAFNLRVDLAGRIPEDLSLVHRLGRVLGYDGEPLDAKDYIARAWASFELDADAEGKKPSKAAWARHFVEERAQYPWLEMASEPKRAASTLLKRLQRLESRASD